jgi:cytochrome c-type biogenesis protein CcmF
VVVNEALLGRGALALALALYVYAALAGAWGAARGSRRVQRSARNALLAALPATAASTGALVTAFLRHDFSLVYVAGHSSRSLPLGYRISALWGGQEGSLLLWLLILAAVAFGAVVLNRRLLERTLPWAVPLLAGIASFFAYLLVFVSSPFDTQPAPLDGAGLNASLQNPYMLAHPPLLYIGYVGLTVPFAFAMAALLSRRLDARWLVATRRWTIVSWTCLGLAILLGSKWAYGTIGWGGYFAWDPVENAALMPWLTATAYLHSVMVQEKKGMLRVWNVSLVVLTFSLALFGTFLTRSGLVNSIHSFSQSSIGAWFVGFIAIVVLGSIALIVVRLPMLRARSPQLESLVSREAGFLYNNLLLVAFALTVLWGVLFPVLSQTVRGVPYSVGPPYYNFFLRTFGLPLLLLTGIGPLVAWRRASLRSLRRGLAWPAAVALVAGVALVAAGDGAQPAGLAAYTFSAFVLAAIAGEFVRGTRARRSLDGCTWPAAFSSLVARNRRRYGGYVVHAAVAMLAIGIAGSSLYGATNEHKLHPGQSIGVKGYSLRYLGTSFRPGANHDELRAILAVSHNGSRDGVIAAGRNHYHAEAFFGNAVAIRTDWLRAEDLFVIADTFAVDGSVDVKVIVNPLVDLIWLAGVVFVLGSFVALWPDAREERRLVRHELAIAKVVTA